MKAAAERTGDGDSKQRRAKGSSKRRESGERRAWEARAGKGSKKKANVPLVTGEPLGSCICSSYESTGGVMTVHNKACVTMA
jgi:hypothetical protein